MSLVKQAAQQLQGAASLRQPGRQPMVTALPGSQFSAVAKKLGLPAGRPFMAVPMQGAHMFVPASSGSTSGTIRAWGIQ